MPIVVRGKTAEGVNILLSYVFAITRLSRGYYNLISIIWFTNRTAFSRSIGSRQNGAEPVSDVKDGRFGSLTALTVVIKNALFPMSSPNAGSALSPGLARGGKCTSKS